MSRRLIDTDILSEILKGKNATVAERAASYLEVHGKLTISAISVAEIVFGLRRVGRADQVARFEAAADAAEVLPFHDEAARLAGRINADLQGAGRTIGLPDVMIASIALHHGLPVVTGNVSHFGYVRDLGYEVDIDNWKQA